MNYEFYKNADGKSVVVKLDSDHKEAVETKCFDSVTPTEETFAKIEKGMSVYEVVELVGLPARSVTFGICSTDFDSEDGVWRVQWSTTPGQEVMTVVSVTAVQPT